MNKVQLKFFGGFRNFFETEELSLNGQVSVADFRILVTETLKDRNKKFDALLLDDSVFATETAVLKETDFVMPGQKIAILPPVCGG